MIGKKIVMGQQSCISSKVLPVALTCQLKLNDCDGDEGKITKVAISHFVHFYWQTNGRRCVCRPDAKGETVHEYMCDVNAGNRGQSVHDITDGHRAHI